jgi:threonine synthase
MSAFAGALACLRCELQVPAQQSATPCPRCAAAGMAIACLPVYDLGSVGRWEPDEKRAGVFRYPQLLPIDDTDAPVSLAEGNTPLLACSRLADTLGVGDLLVKDETRNPTWSYKDRLAAVAVTQAVQAGSDAVVVSSTGNHGAAVAAYSAAAGLPCVVLTLASVPQEMNVLMQSYGARVVALRTGPERWTLMDQLVQDRGWAPMSGYVDPPLGSNPYGVDGYKSIAYELFDALGHAPDVVVVPTAYGDGIAGITRGFAELCALGLITRLPRMVAADPLGAYEAGRRDGLGARVPMTSTVAFSTGTPIATYQGLWALQQTDGVAVRALPDAEIVAAQLEVARLEGIYLENASAAAVAVTRELAASGWIAGHEQVVVVGTSTGLKDTGATAAVLPRVPLIEPTAAALDAALDRAGTDR